ncbi:MULTISPECIES: DUF6894 family protein [unclassified Rhizobium]|uniref:DUF6894 family protein n=1 Tax=unclassified Rhizobium TaxID=2613769 RepID=UPI001AD985AC|nr:MULTISPECIES: hypothetical protein [unclassified Rhizobium]MBO9124047.1 hypothetical protein [Rhizobium sp. 16-488-2b]MBO9174579.1 hypothetical protein [Rhizobium sp. 16-488-2a]
MPIYYFHVVGHGSRIEDLEGTDCADLSAAKEEAVACARDLMAHAIRQGRDISSRSIEVRDARGGVVLTLPFRQAISEAE